MLGAWVKEYAPDGSGLDNLSVSMTGSYSQVVVSLSDDRYFVSATAPDGNYTVVYSVNDSLNRSFSKTQYLEIGMIVLLIFYGLVTELAK